MKMLVSKTLFLFSVQMIQSIQTHTDPSLIYTQMAKPNHTCDAVGSILYQPSSKHLYSLHTYYYKITHLTKLFLFLSLIIIYYYY